MEPVDLLFLATYAGPPVIGAFIGYLTNRIAIRMLFRPLKPWYVFGLRIPMTPGVIPSKRHELAENIGEMVGEHLLTSMEIGSALSREPFQEHLYSLIDNRLHQLFGKDLGPLSSFIPQRFQSYFKIAVQTLKRRLGVGLGAFLARQEWEEQVYGFLSERLQEMGDKQINQLVSQPSRRTLYAVLEGIIEHIVAHPATLEHVARTLRRWLGSAAVSQHPLRAQLPEQVIELLHGTIRKHTPDLLAQMGRQLSEPFIRERLNKGILGGVDHFIESMGPMGAMARGFIDMDSLTATIDTYLTDKEEDVVRWLQEPELVDHIAGVLCSQVDAALDRPVGEWLEQVGQENLQKLSEDVARQLLSLLTSLRGEQPGILQQSLEAWCDQGELTISTLSDQMYTADRQVEIRQWIARECVGLIRSANIERLLHILTDKAVDVILDRPVGSLHAIIPHGVQKGIVEYAVLTTNNMLLKEVPGLVGSLKINQLVREKVDSLDLLKLEGLLLSIMEEQFKYINLFGALLGFLIGCINLLILRLV